jgi:hypothetical protein
MTKLRDTTIIFYLLLNLVPQAQAWYLVQVDKHYETYVVGVGIWE